MKHYEESSSIGSQSGESTGTIRYFLNPQASFQRAFTRSQLLLFCRKQT